MGQVLDDNSGERGWGGKLANIKTQTHSHSPEEDKSFKREAPVLTSLLSVLCGGAWDL